MGRGQSPRARPALRRRIPRSGRANTAAAPRGHAELVPRQAQRPRHRTIAFITPAWRRSPARRAAARIFMTVSSQRVRHVDVSVVVPTYNRSTLLPQTLDSLLAQQVDFEYEIVVVD